MSLLALRLNMLLWRHHAQSGDSHFIESGYSAEEAICSTTALSTVT